MRVAQRDRLPAERSRPEPAPRPDLHRRPDHHRQLRPLHHPDHGGAGGAPRRQRHRGLHVQRHRRSRSASASMSTSCSASASTASSSPRAAPTSAPPIGPLAHGMPVLYVFSPGRRPGRLLPAARRRGRRRARGRAPGQRSAAGGSPMSPGPSGSRRCGCAATAIARRWPPPASPSRRLLPPRRLVGGLGPRGGRAALRGRRAAPDAIFCGNDQIARGAADALRERGIAVPETCRSSASTTGRSWPRRRARRSPPST